MEKGKRLYCCRPVMLFRGVTFSAMFPLIATVILLQTLIIINMTYFMTYSRSAVDYNVNSTVSSVARSATTPCTTPTHSLDFEQCGCGLHFRVDPSEAQVFPAPYNYTKKYLTIGIPTIKRRDGNYIITTITSLLTNMDAVQKEDVLIVVMVADFDLESRNVTFRELEGNFSNEIQSGNIHVIAPPEELYGNFKVTKRTYHQEQDYVEWRSKQNFDYAYLMRYAAPISLYYMQLEDDVITAPDYFTHIQEYIDQQTVTWTCLEFSELGFIGKLYRSRDVVQLSQMLMMFFQEQPVDYTYLYFNMMMTQYQKRLRTPTLFQHQGVHSSFPGKIQPLKDRFYDNMTKKFKGDNPSAAIYTTLTTYMTFLPQLPYSSSEGYFWSRGSPVAGDSFMIVFDEPHVLDRVVIETGSESHPTDVIEHGILQASLTLLKSKDRLECTNDIHLGEFKDGRIEVTGLVDKVKFKVVCLQIKMTKGQTPWVIIKEVAVFLPKTS